MKSVMRLAEFRPLNGNVKGLPTVRQEREDAKMVGVEKHPPQASEMGSLVDQITRGTLLRASSGTNATTTANPNATINPAVTAARGQAVRVGVDLAKRVIQVHAVDSAGRVLTARALTRDKFIAWCAQLPPACIVAMETISSAHHWSRKLISLGLDARIIAAQLVNPYRKQGTSGKSDANDATAICEAACLGPIAARKCTSSPPRALSNKAWCGLWSLQ